MQRLLYIINQTFRFLTFRGLDITSKSDLRVLAFSGVIFAWIAGVGRYWDHPSAYIWQYAGLGSVAYIFILAFIIWAIVWPIKPERWSYLSVLTFVGLTSPLAWLYAVPVERMASIDTAIKANVWFLAIVALWRVALYVQFLRKVGKLRIDVLIIVTLLPLAGIVFMLTLLNLEHAVFEIMAGLEQERTGKEQVHDRVYAQIFWLGIFSMILAPVLFVIYLGIIVHENIKRKKVSRDRFS